MQPTFTQLYDVELTSVLRLTGVVPQMERFENAHFPYGEKILCLFCSRYFPVDYLVCRKHVANKVCIILYCIVYHE